MAGQVVIWIDRADGGREANVGSFHRNLRDKKTGLPVVNPDGSPLRDLEYSERAMKELDGFNGANCADVLAELVKRKERKDATGVEKQLLTMILKVGANILERQRRATNDTLRARHLAEIELEHLTVYIRED